MLLNKVMMRINSFEFILLVYRGSFKIENPQSRTIYKWIQLHLLFIEIDFQ